LRTDLATQDLIVSWATLLKLQTEGWSKLNEQPLFKEQIMAKKILILGGTQFVGRLLSESLSKRNDVEITLFHRGKTNPGLFPNFKHVHGDRELEQNLPLAEQDWDAVLDFSCYYPQTLRRFLSKLQGHTQRYIFISTISVYDLNSKQENQSFSTNDPLLSWTHEDETNTSMLTYGQRKAACEAVISEFPALNAVIFRPGLIYGPYDPTDRAYYWIWRLKNQKQILVPQNTNLLQQITSAQDFARILEQALFAETIPESTYLALTHSPMTFQAILNTMLPPGQAEPQLCKVSSDWLEQQNIHYWQDLPLTLPFERLFENQTLIRDFGSQIQPFTQTMAETREYYAHLGWPQPKTGLSPQKEAELIADLS
jgi:2'-hydroxyisoflavone reductase